MFFSIAHFRKRLAELLAVRKGVYAGVTREIKDSFAGISIEQIRGYRDMILMDTESIVIK